MKKIGDILKNARTDKEYSVAHLEGMTKIKRSFIEEIEKENWDKLPAFPTVLGFIRSLAVALDVDPVMAVAVLRRDYPPKKLNINPKPDISSKFVWSPKLTFAVAVTFVVCVILGYLGYQYYHFISPPHLSIESPKENQQITGNSVLVFGSTEGDVKLVINNQPVLISNDGKFSISIGVAKETKEIDIVATSRSGKSTTVVRKIVVQ
jgi:cytoskeletal protein RodZ